MPYGNRGRGGGRSGPISGITGRGVTRGGVREEPMRGESKGEPAIGGARDRCDAIRDPRARRMCKMQEPGPEAPGSPAPGPTSFGGRRGGSGSIAGFRGRAGGGRRRRY